MPSNEFRKPEWKQLTPNDQLVSILMAIEGTISNVADGIAPKERLNDALSLVEDAKEILGHIPTGSW